LALIPGTRLGVYEVTEQIGEGGMGEVHRATDTKLKRQVAIKILPPSVAADVDRLARFQREAEVLASLNHPNIAAIYGLEDSGGMTALVMELVEGEDLSQRLARGAIPIDEALLIAKQIADALEAAHEQGIIHRDLKPANIKVRADGTVKVLDFGLAKPMDPAGTSSVNAMHSPTLSIHATMQGVILGTAAYMAPEQARGKAVDRRADIWAFGAVLFEMLTGSQPFPGEDISHVLARVIERDPDWSRLPANMPASIARLLRRALQKDPRQRLSDIRDARFEIDDASAEPTATNALAPVTPRSSARWPTAIAIAAVIVALVSVAAILSLRGDRVAPASEIHLELTTPPTTQPETLAVSPDGQKILFVATSAGRPSLWLRALDADAARVLPGTEGASLPFWSPDSRSIGFFADARLKRVDIDGGSLKILASASYGLGGTWNRDGVILFGPVPGRPILRVSATGGPVIPVTRIERAGDTGDPLFLPDGRHFLYTGFADGAGSTFVGQLDDPAGRLLIDGGLAIRYVSSGYLLFRQAGGLFAQRFDATTLRLTGNAIPVVTGGLRAVDASDTGTIVYRAGSGSPASQLVWFDRAGHELSRVSTPADGSAMTMPSLSPDGTRLVFARMRFNTDLWFLDLKRGVTSRFTSGQENVFPVWSPDGSQILFDSIRNGGVHNLYRKAVDGTGADEVILKSGEDKMPTDWSPDGRHALYYTFGGKTQNDIWALSLTDRKPFPLVQTEFEERGAKFSPDGRWIAYQSNESGQFEIYVQPFPGPGAKTRISTEGGAQVRWRHDGKELFYMALDGRLMAVSIRLPVSGLTVESETPTPLFPARPFRAVEHLDGPQYVVSPDGQRFLVNTVGDATAPPIRVIVNWPAARFRP
jgi:serine/threonine protein kinase/Tol biopolymer transport system component